MTPLILMAAFFPSALLTLLWIAGALVTVGVLVSLGIWVVSNPLALLRGLLSLLLLPILLPIALVPYAWQHKTHTALLLALFGAVVLMEYYGIGSYPHH